MPTPRIRQPGLALFGAACVLAGAWLALPGKSRSVQAAETSPTSARVRSLGETSWPARLGAQDGQRTGSPPVTTGSLELHVTGLTIPADSPSHARTTARLTHLSTATARTGSGWSATNEVIDGTSEFQGLPVDQHFELLLTGANGEELLQTTILGPGHGASPELTSVRVSLAR